MNIMFRYTQVLASTGMWTYLGHAYFDREPGLFRKRRKGEKSDDGSNMSAWPSGPSGAAESSIRMARSFYKALRHFLAGAQAICLVG